MDKAIFQFNGYAYNGVAVRNFSREKCEALCKSDEENVTKFKIDTAEELEDILNNDLLDVDNCFFRGFF